MDSVAMEQLRKQRQTYLSTRVMDSKNCASYFFMNIFTYPAWGESLRVQSAIDFLGIFLF